MPLPPTRERPALPIAPDYAPPGDRGPRPRRRWLRRLGIVLGSLLALAAILGVAAYVIIDREINDFITPESADLRGAQKRLQRPLPGEPANILVMGSDFRESDEAEGRRSDTILLVRLDPDRGTISMLSFPRDLWVEIPGYGESKINDAYGEGGSEMTVDTIRELTGLDIHFIATVDFRGFRGIVNELGGVWVDVDRRYFNDNTDGGDDYAEIDLQPGYQKLRGADALAYSRYRHTDSDFHRIGRQQSVLRELKRQVGLSDLARNARGLFNVMDDNTDMAAGGSGQISVRTAVDYLRLAISLESSDIYQFHIEGALDTAPNGASIVTASDAEIAGLVQAFLEPDPEARRQAADLATGQDSEPIDASDDGVADDDEALDLSPADRVGTVPVTVYNGNGVQGSADAVGAALTAEGLTVEVAGNAERFDYATTTVYYGAASDKPAADALAELFSSADVQTASGTSYAEKRLAVVVGATGEVESAATEGLSPAIPPEEVVKPDNQVVPEAEQANVVTDPAWMEAEFAQLRRKADMAVMAPTTREATSTLEGEFRTYKLIRDEKAYRMVFRTGQGAYWGIQGTTWDKPPIIEGPNRTATRNGRELLIFQDGTKIRMIAWRSKGSVFWVSNSVLNELSNATMMEIAARASLVKYRAVE